MKLLEAPRHPDRPAGVPEMAPHFSHDRGHGEGEEVRAALDVVAVHRVDEADAGDLHQILEGLAAAVEASSDVLGEGQAPGDDRFP